MRLSTTGTLHSILTSCPLRRLADIYDVQDYRGDRLDNDCLARQSTKSRYDGHRNQRTDANECVPDDEGENAAENWAAIGLIRRSLCVDFVYLCVRPSMISLLPSTFDMHSRIQCCKSSKSLFEMLRTVKIDLRHDTSILRYPEAPIRY